MQTPMFVFVGLRENKTKQDINILSEKLQQAFNGQKLPITFIKKDELLNATFENVSYYVSIINDKREIEDWTQMAKDFELEGNRKPVDEVKFLECNNRKKIKHPTLYKERHYSVGKVIFESLKNFSDIEIYFYQ